MKLTIYHIISLQIGYVYANLLVNVSIPIAKYAVPNAGRCYAGLEVDGQAWLPCDNLALGGVNLYSINSTSVSQPEQRIHVGNWAVSINYVTLSQGYLFAIGRVLSGYGYNGQSGNPVLNTLLCFKIATNSTFIWTKVYSDNEYNLDPSMMLINTYHKLIYVGVSSFGGQQVCVISFSTVNGSLIWYDRWNITEPFPYLFVHSIFQGRTNDEFMVYGQFETYQGFANKNLRVYNASGDYFQSQWINPILNVGWSQAAGYNQAKTELYQLQESYGNKFELVSPGGTDNFLTVTQFSLNDTLQQLGQRMPYKYALFGSTGTDQALGSLFYRDSVEKYYVSGRANGMCNSYTSKGNYDIIITSLFANMTTEYFFCDGSAGFDYSYKSFEAFNSSAVVIPGAVNDQGVYYVLYDQRSQVSSLSSVNTNVQTSSLQSQSPLSNIQSSSIATVMLPSQSQNIFASSFTSAAQNIQISLLSVSSQIVQTSLLGRTANQQSQSTSALSPLSSEDDQILLTFFAQRSVTNRIGLTGSNTVVSADQLVLPSFLSMVPGGIITLIAFAVFMLSCFLCGLICLLKRWSRKKLQRKLAFDVSEASTNNMTYVIGGTTLSTAMVTTHELCLPAYLECSYGKDFRILDQVAKGGGGSIAFCQVLNSSRLPANIQLVVKTMNQDASNMNANQESAFITEIGLLNMTRDQPQFARMHGYSLAPACILLTYYPLGSLKSYIHQVHLEYPYTKQQLFIILVEFCRGIVFLHGKDFVHNDIKPDNVLLEASNDGYLKPRITDFGIARLVDRSNVAVKAFQYSNIKGLSVSYAAPEAFQRFRKQEQQLTPQERKAADIYSSSIMIQEMLTRKVLW